jgi:hypothetical protein
MIIIEKVITDTQAVIVDSTITYVVIFATMGPKTLLTTGF